MRGFKICKNCTEEKHIDNFYYPENKALKYSKFCNTCNKKLAKTSEKSKSLLKKYNLTLEEFNLMFRDQEGKCAICKTHQSMLDKTLVIDHCHKGGHVRGLLCNHCNSALGFFKDNIESLTEAINYLFINKPSF
jgi:hypothetical protein